MWALATIILFLLVLIVYNAREYENYLGGMWTADSAFCERAGIDYAALYVGENVCGPLFATRHAYLVIGEGITNQGITFSYTRAPALPWIAARDIYARVEYDKENIWDADEVKLTLDMRKGTLVCSAGGEIKLKLFKQAAPAY